MKQLFLLLLLLIAVITFAAWLQKGNLRLSPTGGLTSGDNLKEMKIGGKSLKVEVAKTTEEHEKGLSGRDSLLKDQGMLFFMPADSQPTFLMRGMKFPLDIIWINDSRVVGISENLPPPTSSNENLSPYKAPEPVDWVLEVNASFAKENNITPGTMIELPQF